MTLLIAVLAGCVSSADLSARLDRDGDGATVDVDCDDRDRAVGNAPGWFVDHDGDGFGAGQPVPACEQPEGHVEVGGDCDDRDPQVFPQATEQCNFRDDDCDGEFDEGEPQGAAAWYRDLDGDGFGDTDEPMLACVSPGIGWAGVPGDCDDADATVHPGQVEVCDNEVDDDCDGSPAGCALTGEVSLAPDWVQLLGDTDGDLAGVDVRFAGDLDQDGHLDIVIGAPGRSPYPTVNGPNTQQAGTVYLVYGPVQGLVGLEAASIGKIYGEVDGDAAGAAVAVAGDLTGDLHADLAVGAPGRDGMQVDAGAVVIVERFGRGDAWAEGFRYELLGEVTGDGVGLHLSHGRDLDSDGVFEIAVGATGSDRGGVDRGAVYLVDLVPGTDMDLGNAGLIVEPAGNHGGLGTSPAMVGDLDGDGLEDWGVGAPSGTDGTATVLAFGGEQLGVLPSTSASVSWASGIPGDLAGTDVVGVGDVDGDGADDLWVGAPGDGPGVAYLITGITSGDHDLQMASTAIWIGESSGDRFGSAVAPAGDIDGDGVLDLAVGAPDHDSLSLDGGAVYILSGGGQGTLDVAASRIARIRSPNAAGTLGSSLDGGVDFDGNGLSEILIGAPLDTLGGVYASGAAYLLSDRDL